MVHGAEFRVQGAGCRMHDTWCMVQDAGCRVQGAGPHGRVALILEEAVQHLGHGNGKGVNYLYKLYTLM